MRAWFSLSGLAAPDGISSFLLDGFTRSTVLLLIAVVVCLMVRRASAATRHFVWCLAMGGALVVPAIGTLLPSWRLPLLPVAGAGAEPGEPAMFERPAARVTSTAAVAAPAVPAVRVANAQVPTHADVTGDRTAAAFRRATEELLPAAAAAVAPGRSGQTFRLDVSDVRQLANAAMTLSLPQLLLALWLVGSLLVIARVVLGILRLRSIARRARPLTDPRWLALLPRVREEMGIAHPLVLLESDADAMPMTWGVVRPVLLLPEGSGAWSTEQRVDVLRHELAHVRRRDCLTQLLAQVGCALYWPNPLVWVAARRLHIERERACDDEVVRAGARASSYAEHLLGIANTMRATPRMAFAALAMARRSQLGDRLRALLDDRRSHARVSARAARLVSIAASAVVAATAMATPVTRLEARAPSPVRPSRPAAVAMTPDRAPDALLGTSSRRDTEAVPAAAAASPITAAPATVSDAAEASDEQHDIPETVVVPLSAPQPGDLARPGTSERVPNVLFADGRSLFGRALAALTPSPEPPQQSDARCSKERRSSLSIHSDDSKKRDWKLRWQADDCEMRAEAKGTVVLRGDLTDVDRISDGGSFELEREVGDDHRRIVIESRNGRLERTYYVGRKEQPYGESARAWLATALLELERRTAIAVEQRVPVLLAQGGVAAVIAETDRLTGDYARRRYFTTLLEQRTLTASEVRQVVERAGTSIGSDYELAELLIQVSSLNAFNNESHRAFITASRTLQSDYEHRRALSALLAKPGLSTEVVGDLLASAKDIGSDYELAELLIAVSRRYAVDERTRPMYIEAVSNIESDYEHRRVLSVIMKGGGLSAATTKALLEDATRIGSDYERSEFLIGVVKAGAIDASNRGEYFAAVDGIKSDYEHHRALTTFLRRDALTRDDVKGILRSARRISSDYECASLLVDVAKNYAFDKELRELFLDATETLGSEYERNRALAAMALVKTI